MQNRKPAISIIIPVFNEEFTIGDVIKRVKIALEKMSLPYEILVVDDCSTDNSLRVSLKSEVKVLSLREHKGKGYALRTGFESAKGDIIVTIDSDGSHNPEELPKLITPILRDEADIVIGSRFLDKENIFQNKLNKVGVQFLNLLIKVLTGRSISDSQSGYRALKSELIKGTRITSNGYEIESELLIKALKRGFRTKEIPIKFKQRTYGKSKLDPLQDGLKIFSTILFSFIGD